MQSKRGKGLPIPAPTRLRQWHGRRFELPLSNGWSSCAQRTRRQSVPVRRNVRCSARNASLLPRPFPPRALNSSHARVLATAASSSASFMCASPKPGRAAASHAASPTAFATRRPFHLRLPKLLHRHGGEDVASVVGKRRPLKPRTRARATRLPGEAPLLSTLQYFVVQPSRLAVRTSNVLPPIPNGRVSLHFPSHFGLRSNVTISFSFSPIG